MEKGICARFRSTSRHKHQGRLLWARGTFPRSDTCSKLPWRLVEYGNVKREKNCDKQRKTRKPVLCELPGRQTVSGGLKAEHRSFPGTIEVKICPILGRSRFYVKSNSRIGIARHAASALPLFSINAATQRADLSAPRALDRRVAACTR